MVNLESSLKAEADDEEPGSLCYVESSIIVGIGTDSSVSSFYCIGSLIEIGFWGSG